MKPMARCFAGEGLISLRQRGLVLFMALIALTVLSLAAVALIRSVDTAAIIAGNLAFKQSATTSGEAALIGANKWISDQFDAGVANDILIGNDLPGGQAVGYYATIEGLRAKNGYGSSMSSYAMLSNEITWKGDRSATAELSDCSGSFGNHPDCGGNTVRYVIERMCKDVGEADCSTCLCGPITDSGGSKGVVGSTEAGRPEASSGSPVFRVTARVAGPKNSVSYVQAFVY